MKKFLSVLLCIVLFGTVFSGCEGTSSIGSIEDNTDKPLRICIDFGDTSPEVVPAEQAAASIAEMLEMYYKAGQGGPEKVEMDLIPSSGGARSAALTRVRTEIMSGEGPDVFVCVSPNSSSRKQGLFPFVQKAMASGYFLPLDDYIEEKAQFMEWDKLEPVIMEGGKYDGQQMLIPMAFDLPLTYYHLDEVQKYDSSTTWQEMITSDDPVLAAAATPVYEGDRYYNCWLSSVFGEYVDYEKEKLLITEEDISACIEQTRVSKESGRIREAPDHYSCPLAPTVLSRNHGELPWMNGIAPTAKKAMVPIYSRDGGTTAYIRAYCAINRNTVQPNNAFFAMDYLLSSGMQRDSALYSAWWDMMCADTSYVKENVIQYETQKEEFERVMGQITCVRFWTPLDAELVSIMEKVNYRMWDEEKIQKAISKAYTNMQMILAES